MPINLTKPRRERSESRLEWCHSQPCIVSGEHLSGACDPPVDAHHVTPRSVGGSDFTTLPLCRIAHDVYHQHGRLFFETYYDVRLDDLLAEHNARYRAEHPVVKPKKARVVKHRLVIECGECREYHKTTCLGSTHVGYCPKVRKNVEL